MSICHFSPHLLVLATTSFLHSPPAPPITSVLHSISNCLHLAFIVSVGPSASDFTLTSCICLFLFHLHTCVCSLSLSFPHFPTIVFSSGLRDWRPRWLSMSRKIRVIKCFFTPLVSCKTGYNSELFLSVVTNVLLHYQRSLYCVHFNCTMYKNNAVTLSSKILPWFTIGSSH